MFIACDSVMDGPRLHGQEVRDMSWHGSGPCGRAGSTTRDHNLSEVTTNDLHCKRSAVAWAFHGVGRKRFPWDLCKEICNSGDHWSR